MQERFTVASSLSYHNGKEKMKRSFTKIFILIITLALATALLMGSCVVSSAEEIDDTQTVEGGDANTETVDIPTESGDEISQSEANTNDSGKNIFDQIYKGAEENADKIFAILAFIGTLVVGIGYKSGLIPMLRDALSRLKGSIDGVKADSRQALTKTETGLKELRLSIDELDEAVGQNSLQLSKIALDMEELEKLKKERDAMRIILLSQVDMLYSIFMTSALPQYQKDEIGEYIAEMREELRSYDEGKKA